jgi:hypothetical protein
MKLECPQAALRASTRQAHVPPCSASQGHQDGLGRTVPLRSQLLLLWSHWEHGSFGLVCVTQGGARGANEVCVCVCDCERGCKVERGIDLSAQGQDSVQA